MPERGCQVDFYLLKSPGLDPRGLACRLSLMAWERGHRISVVVNDDEEAGALDEQMWQNPPGRFLPHAVEGDAGAGSAPVEIVPMSRLNPGDVVINLCPQPVEDPSRFSRLLEIVPQAGPGLAASRDKFRYYRGLGIEPATHEISK